MTKNLHINDVLNKFTTTNINLDYTKEIMFSAGCRKAAER